MKNKKPSNLEGLLAVGGMFAPALWFASSYYSLMDKAGMYELTNGRYDRLQSLEGINNQLVGAAGTFALICGGLYAGSKLGGYLSRRWAKKN